VFIEMPLKDAGKSDRPSDDIGLFRRTPPWEGRTGVDVTVMASDLPSSQRVPRDA